MKLKDSSLLLIVLLLLGIMDLIVLVFLEGIGIAWIGHPSMSIVILIALIIAVVQISVAIKLRKILRKTKKLTPLQTFFIILLIIPGLITLYFVLDINTSLSKAYNQHPQPGAGFYLNH